MKANFKNLYKSNIVLNVASLPSTDFSQKFAFLLIEGELGLKDVGDKSSVKTFILSFFMTSYFVIYRLNGNSISLVRVLQIRSS